MAKFILFYLILTFGISIIASENDIQKRDEEVLNVVTRIKPLQQLIRDYLDLPNNLVHTVKLPSASYTISWAYPFFAIRLNSSSQIIFIQNIVTAAQVGWLAIDKTLLLNQIVLSSDAQFLAYSADHKNKHEAGTINVYDVRKQKLIITHAVFRQSAGGRKYDFSHDNVQFIIVDHAYRSNNLAIIIYDTRTGRQMYKVIEKINEPAWEGCYVNFSQKMDNLVVLFNSSLAYLFFIGAKKLIKLDMDLSEKNQTYDISLSPNGTHSIVNTNLIGLSQDEARAILDFFPHRAQSSKKPNFMLTDDSKVAVELQGVPVHVLPIPKKWTQHPVSIKSGTYLTVEYRADEQNPDKRIICIFKNQALDLDCNQASVIDLVQKADTSGCLIA